MTLSEKIITKLKSINDPELRQDVYTLKLITDIRVDEIEKKVMMKFRPTNYNCPIGIHLAVLIKSGLMEIKELNKIEIEVGDFNMREETNEYLKLMDNTIKKEED